MKRQIATLLIIFGTISAPGSVGASRLVDYSPNIRSIEQIENVKTNSQGNIFLVKPSGPNSTESSILFYENYNSNPVLMESDAITNHWQRLTLTESGFAAWKSQNGLEINIYNSTRNELLQVQTPENQPSKAIYEMIMMPNGRIFWQSSGYVFTYKSGEEIIQTECMSQDFNSKVKIIPGNKLACKTSDTKVAVFDFENPGKMDLPTDSLIYTIIPINEKYIGFSLTGGFEVINMDSPNLSYSFLQYQPRDAKTNENGLIELRKDFYRSESIIFNPESGEEIYLPGFFLDMNNQNDVLIYNKINERLQVYRIENDTTSENINEFLTKEIGLAGELVGSTLNGELFEYMKFFDDGKFIFTNNLGKITTLEETSWATYYFDGETLERIPINTWEMEANEEFALWVDGGEIRTFFFDKNQTKYPDFKDEDFVLNLKTIPNGEHTTNSFFGADSIIKNYDKLNLVEITESSTIQSSMGTYNPSEAKYSDPTYGNQRVRINGLNTKIIRTWGAELPREIGSSLENFLYKTFLGREINLVEYDLVSDYVFVETLITQLQRDPEYKQKIKKFIIESYNYHLNRSPDPIGLEFWANRSPMEIFYGIVNSEEYIEKHGSENFLDLSKFPHQEQLPNRIRHTKENLIYRAVLGREITESEYDLVKNDPNLTMFPTSEYVEKNINFIKESFRYHLGREIDATGESFWIEKSPLETFFGIMDSDEYKSLHS